MLNNNNLQGPGEKSDRSFQGINGFFLNQAMVSSGYPVKDVFQALTELNTNVDSLVEAIIKTSEMYFCAKDYDGLGQFVQVVRDNHHDHRLFLKNRSQRGIGNLIFVGSESMEDAIGK